MSAYDEQGSRVAAILAKLDRQARFADLSVNNAADALDAVAGQEAQADAEAIRALVAARQSAEAKLEAATARIVALEGAVDQAEYGLNRAANAMLRGSGTTIEDRMEVQDCFQRIREVRLASLDKEKAGG